MGTTLISSCRLPWKSNLQTTTPLHIVCHSPVDDRCSRVKANGYSMETGLASEEEDRLAGNGGLTRRLALVSAACLVSSTGALGFSGEGVAAVKQGSLAGRIPGLSEPDERDRLEDLPQTRGQIRRPWCRMESYHPLCLCSA